ncbi:transcriptional regulator, TetR family [Frankineae bacterium MT45]|nr:transcriptional regulator, TetR family [Frankineae bacterium MT45]
MNGAQVDNASEVRTRNARGEARREDLLGRITDDVVANGLADFSLRRAARACGTTHKVLLYHFGSLESLLATIVRELRGRRVQVGLSASSMGGTTLAERVLSLWPGLVGPEADALDQAVGLAMTDPARYGSLTDTALDEYLPALRGICPETWDEPRKHEVASLILATLRGLVLTRRTSTVPFDPTPALAALQRALDREESTDSK